MARIPVTWAGSVGPHGVMRAELAEGTEHKGALEGKVRQGEVPKALRKQASVHQDTELGRPGGVVAHLGCKGLGAEDCVFMINQPRDTWAQPIPVAERVLEGGRAFTAQQAKLLAEAPV